MMKDCHQITDSQVFYIFSIEGIYLNFLVRLVIPGFVGGRNVKWLKSIHVEDHESESWYHWHDNKVLPPYVTSGNAESDGYWYKPGGRINDIGN